MRGYGLPGGRTTSLGSGGEAIAAVDRKARLSTLWIFALFNYIYADVLGLYDVVYNGKGLTASTQFTPASLLGAAILLEIPMAMLLLSRELKPRANRWANVLAGFVETIAVLGSTFLVPIMNGTTAAYYTTYYLFFGAIEIACTAFIVWYAWTWRTSETGGPRAVAG